MAKGPHLLAGPLSYRQTETGMHPTQKIAMCKWEFIGFTDVGELRRYQLLFSIETRNFTSNSLTVSPWDAAHAKELANLYRPISVLRHMLPQGSIAKAMRSMLTEIDIAEVTMIAIRGANLFTRRPEDADHP